MLEKVLPLLKVNIGIASTNRDDYLKAIVNSVIDELENTYGIELFENDNNQIMFIVDYSSWKYRNRGEGVIPRNIQFRLHNLVIQNRGG